MSDIFTPVTRAVDVTPGVSRNTVAAVVGARGEEPVAVPVIRADPVRAIIAHVRIVEQYLTQPHQERPA